MSNAQILAVVIDTAEVPAEAFVAAVRAAARAHPGVGTGPWTYDATSVQLQRVSSLVMRAEGGPWHGFEVTFGESVPESRRVVFSAFRQNISGLSSDADSALRTIGAAVRSAVGGPGRELVTAFRTSRNPISFDRGIPAPIDLSQTGQTSGIGWAVVAAIGGLAFVVIRGTGGGGGLAGWSGRRRFSRRRTRRGRR